MNNDNGVITGIFQEILDNEIKELGLWWVAIKT
jgi:hypothetical protein